MKKLELPYLSERIRGLSLPKNGEMFLADYDEVFKLKIEGTPSFEIIDDDPYEFLDEQTLSLGVNELPPILESNGNTISYNFSPQEDYVTVKYNIKGKVGHLKFQTLSGDWFAASFSECGNYLILAEPYQFEIYAVLGT